MSLTFRSLTEADLETLAALDRQLFFEPWSQSALADHLRGGRYAEGAFDGDQLVGYLLGMALGDEAELLQFGVDSRRRRCGIGRQLLSRFLAWTGSRGCRRVLLEVRASARPALALYRKAGFMQDGVRRGYYRSETGPEDALLMSLILGQVLL